MKIDLRKVVEAADRDHLKAVADLEGRLDVVARALGVPKEQRNRTQVYETSGYSH